MEGRSFVDYDDPRGSIIHYLNYTAKNLKEEGLKSVTKAFDLSHLSRRWNPENFDNIVYDSFGDDFDFEFIVNLLASSSLEFIHLTSKTAKDIIIVYSKNRIDIDKKNITQIPLLRFYKNGFLYKAEIIKSYGGNSWDKSLAPKHVNVKSQFSETKEEYHVYKINQYLDGDVIPEIEYCFIPKSSKSNDLYLIDYQIMHDNFIRINDELTNGNYSNKKIIVNNVELFRNILILNGSGTGKGYLRIYYYNSEFFFDIESKVILGKNVSHDFESLK